MSTTTNPTTERVEDDQVFPEVLRARLEEGPSSTFLVQLFGRLLAQRLEQDGLHWPAALPPVQAVDYQREASMIPVLVSLAQRFEQHPARVHMDQFMGIFLDAWDGTVVDLLRMMCFLFQRNDGGDDNNNNSDRGVLCVRNEDDTWCLHNKQVTFGRMAAFLTMFRSMAVKLLQTADDGVDRVRNLMKWMPAFLDLFFAPLVEKLADPRWDTVADLIQAPLLND